MVGHGSGSFGHSVASKYGTQKGVSSKADWRGFSKVATVAAQLNQLILTELERAGIPVFRLQPSASAIADGGRLVVMALQPIEVALSNGLVPLIYGDVAIDNRLGGTIISTESLFEFLAPRLKPSRILLAGDYDGVLDEAGHIIKHITPPTLSNVASTIGESEHVDVTGGMLAKTQSMLSLCSQIEGLSALIFSGAQPGQIKSALLGEEVVGTRISLT